MYPNRMSVAGVALVSMIAAVAIAQNPSPIGVLLGDDAGIVNGQPCTAVEKITESTPVSNGATITKRFEERKWRDAQGRFRKEEAVVSEGQEPVFEKVSIVDPVKNTLTMLNLTKKTATVFRLPDQGQWKLHPYVELSDKELMAMPGVKVKVEKLDGKTIAGVYAVGRRVTRTRPPGSIGNDKQIVSVSERWVSPDLKLLLASSMDDLRQKQTREVTQLDRVDPDPALFSIPADFTVKEMPFPLRGNGAAGEGH
jgi:hypothetical protein